MTLVAYDKPAIRCLVSFPIGSDPRSWTAAAVVSLELAAELQTHGHMVLVDPADERELAMWERLERAAPPKRKWFTPPDVIDTDGR